MNKKVAIIQSSYIPWKGYFDIIGHVDQFVLYDCVQFTKRDWRNRNLIKTTKFETDRVKEVGLNLMKLFGKSNFLNSSTTSIMALPLLRYKKYLGVLAQTFLSLNL